MKLIKINKILHRFLSLKKQTQNSKTISFYYKILKEIYYQIPKKICQRYDTMNVALEKMKKIIGPGNEMNLKIVLLKNRILPLK